MSSPYCGSQNRLLDVLSAAEFLRLSASLESVSLRSGEILYESGCRLPYVYFPVTAIISLASILENGASAELAVVGNEGMVGVALLMGGDTTPSRAVVSDAGHAYRLKGALIKQEFNRGGPLLQWSLRYAQALITQMSQTAACNRHHTVCQRLCRRLLSSLDRCASNELPMTHEQLSHMLGVRREGVTEAAGKLQKAGLIQYHRGHMHVLDRHGLEARACECYRVVKKEYDRLLPPGRKINEHYEAPRRPAWREVLAKPPIHDHPPLASRN